MLLDLERLGLFTVTGDPGRAGDLLRYLAAELACNTWSDHVEVTVAGFDAAETEQLIAVGVRQRFRTVEPRLPRYGRVRQRLHGRWAAARRTHQTCLDRAVILPASLPTGETVIHEVLIDHADQHVRRDEVLVGGVEPDRFTRDGPDHDTDERGRRRQHPRTAPCTAIQCSWGPPVPHLLRAVTEGHHPTRGQMSTWWSGFVGQSVAKALMIRWAAAAGRRGFLASSTMTSGSGWDASSISMSGGTAGLAAR